ncbi:MAG: porin [Gammaproteobacteria bacterium]|nr:porin [Gammaproteobacteria bacterium]
MDKKLIALAVVAVFVTPAASAGTEVYGLAHVSVGLVDDDDGRANQENTSTLLNWNTSNIGFKGIEDLGGGLSAIYQAEVGVDFSGGVGGPDEKAEGLGKFRNTYLGFSGDWGTAIMGRHDTPFKQATEKLDPFNDMVGDYGGVLGRSVSGSHDRRISNMIAYLSPDIRGFSFQLAYGLDDTAALNKTHGSGTTEDQNADGDGDPATGPLVSAATQESGALSVAGAYANGPLYVVVAYQSIFEAGNNPNTLSAGVNDDATATRVGAGYTFGNFTINGLWENIDDGGVGSEGGNGGHDAYYLSGVFAMGSTAFALGYGVADDQGSEADSGAALLSVGVTRSMSKRTRIYAAYTQVAVDKNAISRFNYGIDEGEVTPVTATNIAGVTTNATASSLVLGVSHKFSSK